MGSKKKYSAPPSSLDDWKKQVEKQLKGADTSSLNTQTAEGIELKALYTREDADNLDYGDTLPGIEPFIRGPQATMYAGRPCPSGGWHFD